MITRRFHPFAFTLSLVLLIAGIVVLKLTVPKTAAMPAPVASQPALTNTTEQGAMELVYQRPEVEAFIEESEDRGNEPSVRITNIETIEQDGFWDIQVYESVAGMDEGHEATFNHYRVYARDGRIVPMFNYAADGSISLNPEY